jgi:hypothetical protein
LERHHLQALGGKESSGSRNRFSTKIQGIASRSKSSQLQGLKNQTIDGRKEGHHLRQGGGRKSMRGVPQEGKIAQETADFKRRAGATSSSLPIVKHEENRHRHRKTHAQSELARWIDPSIDRSPARHGDGDGELRAADERKELLQKNPKPEETLTEAPVSHLDRRIYTKSENVRFHTWERLGKGQEEAALAVIYFSVFLLSLPDEPRDCFLWILWVNFVLEKITCKSLL